MTEPAERARIVCLCGSMRFQAEINDAAIEESLAGAVVVLPLVNMKQPHRLWADDAQAEQIKARLDELHLEKIRLADEVLVVCPGDYVGESTAREIAYAQSLGKTVRRRNWVTAPDGSEPEWLRHELARRMEDCDRVQVELMPILTEHPHTQDDVDVDSPRAGHVARVAADLLRHQADELEMHRQVRLAAKPDAVSDPESDPIGTVRRDNEGRLFVRTDEHPPANWVIVFGPALSPLWRTAGHLAETVVVGVVPGTPAADTTPRHDRELADRLAELIKRDAPPAAGTADTAPGTWKAGDIALDRTNFVWQRGELGWRLHPRTTGTQYRDEDIEVGLEPLTRLDGIPSEVSAIGAVPPDVAAQLRQSAEGEHMESLGGGPDD